MCLYVLKSMPKKLTTTKHYIVYKRLKSARKPGKPGYVPPYYTYFFYEPGVLYLIKSIASITTFGRRIVERGFHAYRTEYSAKCMRYTGEVVVPCIVPAGSEVFYGDNEEVVSNKLIVFKNIEQLNEWCANNPVT